MKNPLIKEVPYFLSVPVTLLIMFLTISSCNSQKPIVQKQSTVNIDSLFTALTKLTQINREVNDKTSIYLPDVNTGNPDCDSLCNAKMREMLITVNRQIESGNNKYQLLYNQYTKTLDVLTKMAATQDTQTEKEESKTKIKIEKEYKEIPVPFVPWYYKYSAYAGWVFIVLLLFKIQNKLQSWLLTKKSTT
ncbi:hypothetical protein V1389_01945 [Flavobacterium rakeshii]|uniref:hypothetical protein n=1 Tax=Flavobacterium rakeshii TaxID=1038845 RepID=UPI002E7BEFBB|nr:hypothetical protein [Flavobacterium rakeshii]MEE1897078.1 hypothetical protein [Flavobacterium rakeshii]